MDKLHILSAIYNRTKEDNYNLPFNITEYQRYYRYDKRMVTLTEPDIYTQQSNSFVKHIITNLQTYQKTMTEHIHYRFETKDDFLFFERVLNSLNNDLTDEIVTKLNKEGCLKVLKSFYSQDLYEVIDAITEFYSKTDRYLSADNNGFYVVLHFDLIKYKMVKRRISYTFGKDMFYTSSYDIEQLGYNTREQMIDDINAYSKNFQPPEKRNFFNFLSNI